MEVINAGFEESVVDGVIPGWTQIFGVGKDGSITVDSSQKYKGNNSLKIDDKDSTDYFGVESVKLAVDAGSEYSVSSAVYIAGGSIQMQLRFYDSANKTIKTAVHDANFQGTPINVWQTISLSAVAPAGAAAISIVLVSAKNGKGVSYWDDVQLTRVDSIPQPDPEPSKLTIANSGFEQPVTGGEPIPGWTIKSGQPIVTSDMKRMGEQSLLASLTPGDGVPAINIESGLIDVEENTTYTLSAEVFLQTGTMEGLYVYVYDKDGKLVKSESGKDFHVYLSATTDQEKWKYHEATFTVQPGGVKLKVSLITGAKKALHFYVDEVSVMKKVPNGDFERSVAAGVIPGWSKVKTSDASSFTVTSERSNSGDNSLHFVNTAGEYLNVISDLIPVEAGATYTAAARTWIESGSSDMYVRFFDAQRNYMNKQAWSILSGPTDVWFDQYVTAVVPRGRSMRR